MFPELIGSSTLKREVVDGLDLLILRELNGDVYYGEPRGIGCLFWIQYHALHGV